MPNAITAFFSRIGPWEIVIILAAFLLLFGGKRLPELAKGLGRGLRLFKEELMGVKKEIEKDQNQDASDDQQDKQV